MLTGIVKWIKVENGYGVIEHEEKAYIFYVASILGTIPTAGDTVEFEIIPNSRYAQANNVKKVGA